MPSYIKKPWTFEELQVLKENYGTMSIRNLSLLIPTRTPSAIKKKANHLGIAPHHYYYTKEDVDLILSHPTLNNVQLSKLIPNHSPDSIGIKRKSLGVIQVRTSKRWSEEEIAVLKELRKVHSRNLVKHAKEYLAGRSEGAIWAEMRKLGLHNRKNRPWSKEEDDLIRKEYSNIGVKLAEKLEGRTRQALISRARILGVSKREQ